MTTKAAQFSKNSRPDSNHSEHPKGGTKSLASWMSLGQPFAQSTLKGAALPIKCRMMEARSNWWGWHYHCQEPEGKTILRGPSGNWGGLEAGRVLPPPWQLPAEVRGGLKIQPGPIRWREWEPPQASKRLPPEPAIPANSVDHDEWLRRWSRCTRQSRSRTTQWPRKQCPHWASIDGSDPL